MPASVSLRSVSRRTGAWSEEKVLRRRPVVRAAFPILRLGGARRSAADAIDDFADRLDGPAFRNVTERRSLGSESGKRAAVAGSRPAGWRPSSLARTGSKSTNQLWNSARAIASSVAFIRRFNSILSSSAPSTAAMAFCSARGGSGMLKFGMSAHFKLSNTAPTLMKVPTCSHQSVPRTSQRRNGGNSFLPSARSKTRFCPSGTFKTRRDVSSFAWIAAARQNHVVMLRHGLSRPLGEVLRRNAANIAERKIAFLELRNRNVWIAAVGGREACGGRSQSTSRQLRGAMCVSIHPP